MSQLTNTQRKLQSEAREFAQTILRPNASRLDLAGGFPREWFRRCGELGFVGASFPVEYGGLGYGYLETVLILEELAKQSCALGAALSAHIQCAKVLQREGSEEQKQEILRPALDGELLLAYALTEKNSGSDVLALETTAEKVEDGWLISGSKRWITNAGEAQAYVLSAKTDSRRSRRGVSLFLVERNTPGLHIAPIEHKMGVNNLSVGNLSIDGCRLPERNLVGEAGRGYDISHIGLDDSRLYLSAVAVGVAAGALEHALDYTKRREQFDRAITSYQGVSFPLSEMYTNLCAARAMLYEAARDIDCGRSIRITAAALKLFASETCCRICDQALQLLGGNGYSHEYEIERYLRDSRMLKLAGGTSEICKVIISNSLIY